MRVCLLWVVGMSASAAFAQTSADEHVAPDAPQTRVHSMPYRQMTDMMGMDDRKLFGKVMLDEIEWRDSSDASSLAWDVAAWYGGDYDKLRVESQGMRENGVTRDARTELLWERIITPWWSLRAGARHDAGTGPARDWAALGFAGTAPGMIEVEAAMYLGENGRAAARLSTHHDLLLTQRLVLQPQLEFDAYAKDDPARLTGAGVSDVTVGLRLRYELRREFAPYLGVTWAAHLGETADLRRAAGEDEREVSVVAGVRAWF